MLKEYAIHVDTNEPIPQELLDKMLAARAFNSGFNAVEFTASALVDMAYHRGGQVDDPTAFEKTELDRLHMPKAIIMRHRPTHFTHVFTGDGYSAGGSRDPEELYKAFRGRLPSPDAMIRKRGLV